MSNSSSLVLNNEILLKDINMARAMEQYASDLMPEGSKSYLSPVTPDN